MTPHEFFDAMRYFGDPKVPDGKGAGVVMSAYITELDRYAPDVLRLAAERLIQVRKHRNFPLPEECRRACVDAQNELAEQRMRSHPKKPPADPWSAAHISRADGLMNSEIGRRAAVEDWIVHLHDWCRKNGRLPVGAEVMDVRRKGLEIKADRERLAVQAQAMDVRSAAGRIVRAAQNARAAKHSRLSAIANGDRNA